MGGPPHPQWQFSHPATGVQAAAFGMGEWTLGTMVPMTPQSGLLVGGDAIAMPSPAQPFVAGALGYNADEVAGWWPLQAFDERYGSTISGFPSTGTCYWQAMPPAISVEHSPQQVIFMPVCVAGPCFQEAAPIEFASSWVDSGFAEQQTPTAPLNQLPWFLPSSGAAAISSHAMPTVPVTGLCGLETAVEAESACCENLAEELVAEMAEHPERLESMASGEPAEGLIDICAIQWDTRGYASSDASTAVSRSARRRRGRRVAKAKAHGTSVTDTGMLILESGAADPDRLSVSEETKRVLIQQMETGGDTMNMAISSLFGSVLKMSFEPFGCRVMQSALDLAGTSEKDALVAELHGHVLEAVSSPHANFVIQKVIEVLPVMGASFVAKELTLFAAEVARHRFGCRILCRLVEHHLCGGTTSPATTDLIEELLLDADQLIRHNFARHVLDLILEHGSETHKKQISDAIRSNLFHNAKNRNASYVVEKALCLCSAADTHALASELLSDPARFLTLAVHECGCHVVKAVLKSHAECAQQARELLLAKVAQVRASKYGKQLLDEM